MQLELLEEALEEFIKFIILNKILPNIVAILKKPCFEEKNLNVNKAAKHCASDGVTMVTNKSLSLWKWSICREDWVIVWLFF